MSRLQVFPFPSLIKPLDPITPTHHPSASSSSDTCGSASSNFRTQPRGTSTSSPVYSRQLDNFEDEEEILKCVEEVETYLSRTSHSEFEFLYFILINSLILLNLARDHPAGDRDLAPRQLARYHPMYLPKEFTHLEFADTMISWGMKTFNSVTGVTPEQWFLLSTSSCICPGCRNVRSIDGFRSHIKGGQCPTPGKNGEFYMPPSARKLN